MRNDDVYVNWWRKTRIDMILDDSNNNWFNLTQFSQLLCKRSQKEKTKSSIFENQKSRSIHEWISLNKLKEEEDSYNLIETFFSLETKGFSGELFLSDEGNSLSRMIKSQAKQKWIRNDVFIELSQWTTRLML